MLPLTHGDLPLSTTNCIALAQVMRTLLERPNSGDIREHIWCITPHKPYVFASTSSSNVVFLEKDDDEKPAASRSELVLSMSCLQHKHHHQPRSTICVDCHLLILTFTVDMM